MYFKKSFLVIILVAMGAFAAQAQTAPQKGTPCITMNVENGAEVRIKMTAAEDNITVWVENGKGKYEKVDIGTTSNVIIYTARGNTIKVHGNMKEFDCCGNGTNLTGLSFSSGLTKLTNLSCYGNSLQSLDVSKLTNLTSLDCSDNIRLQSLNVRGLTKLEMLFCKGNNLQSLDVSGLTSLNELNCRNNDILQSLNLSGLTKLASAVLQRQQVYTSGHRRHLLRFAG